MSILAVEVVDIKVAQRLSWSTMYYATSDISHSILIIATQTFLVHVYMANSWS